MFFHPNRFCFILFYIFMAAIIGCSGKLSPRKQDTLYSTISKLIDRYEQGVAQASSLDTAETYLSNLLRSNPHYVLAEYAKKRIKLARENKQNVPHPRSFAEAEQLVQSAIFRKEMAKARSIAENLDTVCFRPFDIMILTAKVALAEKDYEKAASLTKEIIARDTLLKNKKIAYDWLGKSYSWLHDWNQARSVYQEAFKKYSDDSWMCERCAIFYNSIGDFDTAIAIAKTIKDAPWTRNWCFGRSYLGKALKALWRTNAYEDAEKWFLQASESDTTLRAESYYNIGVLKLFKACNLKEYERALVLSAIDAFKISQEYDPTYTLSSLLLKKTKVLLDSCNAHCDTLINSRQLHLLMNNPALYFRAADSSYNLGFLDMTLSYYAACLFCNPNNTDAFLERGLCQDDLGNYNEAIADDSRAIELNPNYAPPYNNRALAFVHCDKNLDKALQDANKALALAKGAYQCFDTRGDVYRKMHQVNLAIEDYKKALDLCDKIAPPTYEDEIAKSQIKNKFIECSKKRS